MIASGVGIASIIYYCYYGINSKIFIYWTRTSMIPCFYILPIATVCILKWKAHCKILEIIGKSSFNIFLTQMVFYNEIVYGWLYSNVGSKYMQFAIIISCCLLGGIIFYLIENAITTKIVKYYREKTRNMN